jgi:hypothetical protein
VLCWPKDLVKCESYIAPGFADYRLIKPTGEDILFIEAKKAGEYFSLPNNFNSSHLSSYISLNELFTEDNIRKAIEQVRNYCMEEGCEYACITNGSVWIIFKTFERGKNWKQLKAFVIKDIKYFSEKFIDATNKFGFTSINNGSLKNLIGTISRQNREIFYPKEKIIAYKQKVDSNNYVRDLRPIANKYFGVINVDDNEFMDHCYVSQRDYELASTNFRNIIKDTLSPYFQEYGIEHLEENDKGGRLGNRIKKSLRDTKKGEALILFGGKGSGKSTFLRKLFYFNPPIYISNHSQIAIVDLLNTPETQENIYDSIWNQIIEKLDTEKLLEAGRDALLTLFHDKYENAKRQILFGLDDGTDAYNLRLNDLIKEWLSDKKYCATRLIAYWKRKKRGIIVVVDNTDQFSTSLQDFCFSSAQEIAATLNCLVIISMREERFHSSNIHGTLDAYQNSGFHISSPITSAVFSKRISFVLSILEDEHKSNDIENPYYHEKITSLHKLFTIFANEFAKGDNSPLCEFLTACAHGNIRLALDLFRDLIQSGYTNVDEWISVDGIWTIKIHQVLKPFMIPYRFFYDETQSKIPNIYQIRSKSNGSHFTSLRILHRLCEGIDPNNPFYVSTSELKEFFAEYFNMVEDFEKNLDVLLRYNMIESNNRIDSYNEDVDSVKVTTYGLYTYRTLCYYFTYIDLVSSDCGYFNEKTANEMVIYSNEDFRLFNERKRFDRIKSRLEKAGTFIDYLVEEELKENELFQLKNPSNFAALLRDKFIEEKEAVIKSANNQKNYYNEKY